MADLDQIQLPSGSTYDLISKTTKGVVRATMDSSSTSTAFVATADGITSLYDGLTILLKNTVVASESGCTLDLNGLGAKSILASLNAGAITTQWALNSTYMFMYNATEDKWEIYQGYDTNTNTLAYNVEYYYHAINTTGNGLKRNSMFMRTANGLISSITTGAAGTGVKAFDTTRLFDFTNILFFNSSTSVTSGSAPENNTIYTIYVGADTRYTANNVTTSASTSVFSGGKSLYMVFNKPSVANIKRYGGYMSTLASTISTAGPFVQDPLTVTNPENYIFVLLGVMRDSYRLNLIDKNTAYMVHLSNVGNNLVTYDPQFVLESETSTYSLYLATPLVCDANDTAYVANNTNVVVTSYDLSSTTAGKYIIIASVKYPAGSSSSNQWRYTQISTSSGATDSPISTQFLDNISMPGNSQYVAHLMGMVDTSSVSNVYLKAWHNLGASVNVSYCMQIIRIGNSNS